MASKKKSLVIFDCDGVLVDSEIIACSLKVRKLNDIGINITLENFMREFVGGTKQKTQAKLESDWNIKYPEDFEDNYKIALEEEFKNKLKPVQGIVELLKAIPNKCVASNSNIDRINLTLDITGLKKYFLPEHIFSAEMVKSPKPAPELFLHALEKTQTSPQSAIVIEDSLSGLKAAHSAKIECIALMAGSHFNYKSQIDKILNVPNISKFYTAKEALDFIKKDLVNAS